MALSPIVARIFGERKEHMINRIHSASMFNEPDYWSNNCNYYQLSLPLLLEIVGIDIEFRYLVVEFLDAIIYGAPGIFLFLVFRYTTEACLALTVMYSSIIAPNPQYSSNYILIFGNFGAPKLGVLCCGFASAISMWLVFLFIFLLILFK